MQIIADLHIHSKYSRACSPNLTLENIASTCQKKGVNIVGTGDFTHPEWFYEMKNKLVEKEKGLYVLKSKFQMPNDKSMANIKHQNQSWIPAFAGMTQETRFICSTEISCIYSKNGKCRRVHIIVLAPSLKVVEKINLALGKTGNLKSNGRPILGLDAKELARIIFDISDDCVIIPAHIWTPWFAVFGSKSGFDSLEECFEELTPKIFAIETGLSSDPQMNWRIKNLDHISIISNSDAHSLQNIAREANVFEIDEKKISYLEIIKIIKEKNPKKFLQTIEFYPEEGLYHFDGHRVCNFSCTPKQSKKIKNICPVCKKSLTIGVLNRIEELADTKRNENYINKNRVPFKKIVELDKIIAEALDIKSRSSKQVQNEYKKMIDIFDNELNILLNVSYDDLLKNSLPQVANGIQKVREGKVVIKPGFDGKYGKISIFDDKTKKYPAKLF